MPSPSSAARFDFAAFSAAVSRKDAAAWAAFYADDAEWIEYRPTAPPRAPRRRAGRQQIDEYLRAVAAEDLVLTLGDEVIGPERAAFSATCAFPDGRRIIEHVIVHLRDGKIARQVDVEAWD